MTIKKKTQTIRPYSVRIYRKTTGKNKITLNCKNYRQRV